MAKMTRTLRKKAQSQLALCRSSVSSDEWYTPIELIRALGEFDLDPACGPLCVNRTARRRLESNGLEQPWTGRVWMNPPFSEPSKWIEKFAEHGNGIALVFARTDALWFQSIARKAGGFFMFMGRTKFVRPNAPPSNCPLGCVLFALGPGNREAILAAGFRGLWVSCDSLFPQASPLKPQA